MYNELFAAWQFETENSELGRLPSDFYTRLADYLQIISEKSKLASEKSLNVNLMNREAVNVKRMVEELLSTRYRKIAKRIIKGQVVPLETLVTEEVQLCNNLSSSADAYNKFASVLLSGQSCAINMSSYSVNVDTASNDVTTASSASTIAASASAVSSVPAVKTERVVVRFLKQVPAIIGIDMKTYGPFMVEDVASVPKSNAKILVRQSLAKMIEFL